MQPRLARQSKAFPISTVNSSPSCTTIPSSSSPRPKPSEPELDPLVIGLGAGAGALVLVVLAVFCYNSRNSRSQPAILELL